MTLMFSKCQAIACAEAGATLISPFVGRVSDWYKKTNDVKEYQPSEDPGVKLVTEIYNHYKKYGYQTTIMGASFRNKGQVLQLAGCDKLTIAPKWLQAMKESKEPVPVYLKNNGKQSEPGKQLDEQTFRKMLGENAMATEKLDEGIKRFTADIVNLENILKGKMSTKK